MESSRRARITGAHGARAMTGAQTRGRKVPLDGVRDGVRGGNRRGGRETEGWFAYLTRNAIAVVLRLRRHGQQRHERGQRERRRSPHRVAGLFHGLGGGRQAPVGVWRPAILNDRHPSRKNRVVRRKAAHSVEQCRGAVCVSRHARRDGLLSRWRRERHATRVRRPATWSGAERARARSRVGAAAAAALPFRSKTPRQSAPSEPLA